MHAIHQLIYVSTYNSGRVDNPLQALRAVVRASCANNSRDGITGYLIFDGAGFLQVLEGVKADVDRTYDRIQQDPRHRNARLIGTRSTDDRSFAVWSMAGYLRSPQDDAIFGLHGVNGSIVQAPLTVEGALALTTTLARRKIEDFS